MRNLYITFFLALNTVILHAQYQKLDMPKAEILSKSSQFQPATITFGNNLPKSNDGLRAQAFDHGRPIMIEGTPNNLGRSGYNITAKGRDFLFAAGPIMGIDNTDEEMKLISSKIDERNVHHLKYQQMYNGIPVYGSEELVIYQDQLTYHTTAYSNLIDRSEVFINAHTGELINSYKSFCKFHNHDHSSDIDKPTCNHDHIGNHSEVTTIAAPMGDQITNATDLLGMSRTIHTYEESGTYYMMDISRLDMFNANSNLPNEPEGVIWTINANIFWIDMQEYL